MVIRKLAGRMGISSFATLFLGTVLSFVALAASVTPPNLAKTLAAQQQLVADRPYDAEVHNDHGNLLVLVGRHDEAGEAYRRAIELAPGDTLARYNLGILLQQTGRSREALATFQDLLEIDARYARAHYQLGMLFHGRKQRSKALEHYARAFAYDPELTFATNNPHIIDNPLATEALLVSQRYGDAPSSNTPRLYGEPDRIVDLMLAEAQDVMVTEPEAEGGDEGGEEEDGEDEENARSRTGAYFEADDADSEEDSEDEDDSDSDSDEKGRTLTGKDLATGSSVGQVQVEEQRRPGRRSSAGRDSGRAGRQHGGVPAVRPRGRKDSGDGSANDGRQGRGVPRYRPTSRLSTGRLDLELLPAGEPQPRGSATATR